MSGCPVLGWPTSLFIAVHPEPASLPRFACVDLMIFKRAPPPPLRTHAINPRTCHQPAHRLTHSLVLSTPPTTQHPPPTTHHCTTTHHHHPPTLAQRLTHSLVLPCGRPHSLADADNLRESMTQLATIPNAIVSIALNLDYTQLAPLVTSFGCQLIMPSVCGCLGVDDEARLAISREYIKKCELLSRDVPIDAIQSASTSSPVVPSTTNIIPSCGFDDEAGVSVQERSAKAGSPASLPALDPPPPHR